jgi:Flp pilus assembly protein TadG
MLMFCLFIFTVILVIGALVIDAGLAITEKHRVQNATDAAALAAALNLAQGGNQSSAQTAACTYWRQNGFDSTAAPGSCPNLQVHSPPTQGAHQNSSSVEVIGDTSTHAFFFDLFTSIDSFEPSARSVAGFTPNSNGPPCGFCVLASSGTALTVAGNGSLTVNAPVTVNSNSSSSIQMNGNHSHLTATSISTVGGVSGNGIVSPTPKTGAQLVPDPLAGLPVPSGLTAKSSPASGGNVTINPGIYTTINRSGGTLTMTPGTYVIKTGLTHSNGSIVGNGVTIYFACSAYPTPCNSGQAGAGWSVSGQATETLTAPTSGTYKGLLIFFDRNNTASMAWSGQGVVNTTGTIYAKSGLLSTSGNSSGPNLHSLVVVGRASISGNGSVTYNPAENVPTGGGGGSPSSVTLVE